MVHFVFGTCAWYIVINAPFLQISIKNNFTDLNISQLQFGPSYIKHYFKLAMCVVAAHSRDWNLSSIENWFISRLKKRFESWQRAA